MDSTAYLNLWLKEGPCSCKKSKPVSLAQKELTYKVKYSVIQGGSNMTGTDLCVNKPHCAAAVRP